MGWENIPPNTCPIDSPVLPAVELVDQDGRILNCIIASMCDAEWLALAYAELEVYEGVTEITCRPRPAVAEEPPAEFPPIGDAPPAPPMPEPELPAEPEPVEGQ